MMDKWERRELEAERTELSRREQKEPLFGAADRTRLAELNVKLGY